MGRYCISVERILPSTQYFKFVHKAKTPYRYKIHFLILEVEKICLPFVHNCLKRLKTCLNLRITTFFQAFLKLLFNYK